MDEKTQLLSCGVNIVHHSEKLSASVEWNKYNLASTTNEPQEQQFVGVVSNQGTFKGGSEREAKHFHEPSLCLFKRVKLILLQSHWPFCCFVAIAFPGVWLPQKRKSKWILTVAPLCLLVFGLVAHFYFFATAGHGRVHIGTKILLSSLWISGFCSYILALHHFKFKDQEYVRTLNRNDWLYVNIAFYTGILAVSFVLFEDAYYQVIFDLVNIKKTVTRNCDHHGHRWACDAAFYTLATSIYWGLYSAVVVCCVFLCVCLSTCNTLTKGYAQIEKSTDDVRGVLKYYSELRQDVEEIMNSIKVWFSVHLLFYVLVLIANIYEWCEAATIFHHPYEYTAQIAGTLIVAYKFFFPFISASYVTWHELNLAHALNDKVDYENNQTFYCRQSLEIFLKQSKRRGYGFRLYNIQITITIAIFSLLGSIVCLAHNFLHH